MASAYSLRRLSLASLGVIASGLVLALGIAAGLYLFSAAVAAAGLAGVLLLIADGIRAADSDRQCVEARHDGDWDRQETSALLSTIHDALGDLAIMRGMDGKIVHANAAFHRACGIDGCQGADLRAPSA